MNLFKSVMSWGVLVGVLSLLPLMTTCVPVGHVGVVKKWGEVKPEKTLSEGFHFIVPVVTDVVNYSTKVVVFKGKATASSKDLQDVSTDVSVQFFVGNNAEVLKNVGKMTVLSNLVINPAVLETVKSVTALYTAKELITKRVEVKTKIDEYLRRFLDKTLTSKKLKKDSIQIANLAITEFSFSEEFTQSIELKVKAEQDALKEEYNKRAKITKAEAEAKKIRLESVAKANAIKREARALRENKDLIKYKQIEKWDGAMPKFLGGGTTLPILDLKSK